MVAPRIFHSLCRRVADLGFSKFVGPDLARLANLSEIEAGDVAFMIGPSQLFKLRDDFTKSIIEYFRELCGSGDRNPSGPTCARFWYDGYVYSITRSGELVGIYELGLEVLPGDVFDLAACIDILIESYKEVSTADLIVELGDARVLRRLTEHIPTGERRSFLDALDRKDVAELEVLGSFTGTNVEKLVEVVRNSFVRRALSDWVDFDLPTETRADLEFLVSHLAGASGVAVEVDFSLARTVEEYSGPTFAIFDSVSSKLVAAGGKYSLGNGLEGVGGTMFVFEIKV